MDQQYTRQTLLTTVEELRAKIGRHVPEIGRSAAAQTSQIKVYVVPREISARPKTTGRSFGTRLAVKAT